MMKLNKGNEIEFNNSKFFHYLKELGQGGTGEIHLFLDKTTDMKFAIKKYSPYNEHYREEFYKRFVNEIKILFKISHPNIVRIYNYYLYPKYFVGYLQMEYIEGMTIDKYNPSFWEKQWEEIFSEVISAFCYLESKKILHRDIRASNIMITEEQEVKIIDFGFGKNFENLQEEKNSILLNWPVTELPEEIKINKEYNQQSEIYFLGKLFYSLLKNKNELKNFKYKFILEKMCQIELENRYSSFKEIEGEIAKGLFLENKFSEEQRHIYQIFANNLEEKIISYQEEPIFQNDSKELINSLNNILQNNSLEQNIQNNVDLIKTFIKSSYTYDKRKSIPVDIVKEFYLFFFNLSYLKQQVVLNNLYSRLSTIEIILKNDEFPF